MPIRNFLPQIVRSRLWGDRERWGRSPNYDVSCWREWKSIQTESYLATQREGLGMRVCNAGYRVMSDIDLDGKRVLEIGAGDIHHMSYWRMNPGEYLIAYNSRKMVELEQQRLEERGIACSWIVPGGDGSQLHGVEDNSIDLIISFFSLEHLHPLQSSVNEFKRVLKRDGKLIGAIPTEGGLAWGGGRLLTSRRWFIRNTTIDYDKIICWEHPNYSDEILTELGSKFQREFVDYWPISFLQMTDLNLVIRFCYRQPAA